MKHDWSLCKHENLSNFTSASCRTVRCRTLYSNILSWDPSANPLMSNPGFLLLYIIVERHVPPDTGAGLSLPSSSLLVLPHFSFSSMSAATFQRVCTVNRILTPPCYVVVGSWSSTSMNSSDRFRKWQRLDAGQSASHIWTTTSWWRLWHGAAERPERGDYRAGYEGASWTTSAVSL